MANSCAQQKQARKGLFLFVLVLSYRQMDVLEIIEKKQADITQQYADFEQQEANINAEKLRLQGENRAYEYIKQEVTKEKTDASDLKKSSQRRGPRK